ncbi:Cadmium, cobalt and zinc/H(+)-K(+) antiporter [Maioricimonas rarisocia]|uniref:Cadmium, cobalt and zinc/H(+)-K(+) antiporter n=1 Tax=Maioricimonas rarisocia TaxID=2528026 RepID=A0A517Z7Y5_9PLAN|nr:cation diffusion facilitator family transporter [Maioricimonas rarisocia]QDU38575.1 Cadmium, cobalt and zinc/H(+)-K(+) antiporter [Maioricimonas rarisocia]
MHAHSHQHHGHHHHGPADYGKAFAVGVVLNVIYIIVEAVFGWMVGSLALLADAGHNLSDVFGLLLAWGGAWLASLKPTRRFTYGWRSSSIFSALINGMILMIAVGGIVWEAIRRFGEPQSVSGSTVMWVAGVGVVINTATALLFVRGRKGDVNVRGAFLHMAADAAVSLGVVLGGLGILLSGWTWIDPVISLIVAVVILWSTWGLLRESVELALHAVPAGIDPEEVEEYLGSLPGVAEVHDLHIWAMSTTETALTAHLVKPQIDNEDQLLHSAAQGLRERFRIHHVTIQVERSNDGEPCHQSLPGTV